MLDRINITFLSEKFFGPRMRIFYWFKMTTIVIAVGAEIMTMLVVSIVAVSTTFAVTDNNNTDGRAGAVENDRSSVVGYGSADNNESAKSGINTTVCGPDAPHACQTSSGEK